MEPVLTNHAVQDASSMRSVYRRILRPRIIWMLALSLAMLAYAVYYTVTYTVHLRGDTTALLLNLLLYALGIFEAVQAFRLVPRFTKIFMKQMHERYRTDSVEVTSTFTEEGVVYRFSTESDPPARPYSEFRGVIEYKNFLLLKTAARMILILDRNRFESGTEADFWKLMNEKAPKAVPKRRRV